MNTAHGALQGNKVIDLSRVLGGLYCTQILADHGADVLKIEPPQGDETRGWGRLCQQRAVLGAPGRVEGGFGATAGRGTTARPWPIGWCTLACPAPCALIQDLATALAAPHTAHRDLVVQIGDTYRGVASPIKLSRTPATYCLPPP